MDATLPARTPILDHPKAQALLEQATLTPAAVRGCEGRLSGFLGRYLPLFGRREQRDNATTVVEGLLSGLERKTCEPIAREHGVQRKPIQSFVGSSPWDDEAVMAELRRHVKDELADAGAVLVVDPSGFPKKGTASCGVKRDQAAVVRAAGQGGELPGGRVPVLRGRRRPRPAGPPAVPPGGGGAPPRPAPR